MRLLRYIGGHGGSAEPFGDFVEVEIAAVVDRLEFVVTSGGRKVSEVQDLVSSFPYSTKKDSSLYVGY